MERGKHQPRLMNVSTVVYDTEEELCLLKRFAAALMVVLMLAVPIEALATDEDHGQHPDSKELETEAQAKPEPTAANVNVLSTNPADYAQPVTAFAFGIPESDPVDDSFFDDAVFIGDSISLKLDHYVKNRRQTEKDYFGKARFLVAGSLGSGNALWKVSNESVHPSYRGEKMLLEDAVKRMEAKKVYIMLGINDVALYGLDGSVENMKTLIERILEKSPKAEIFVQSATPRIAASTKKPNNRMIFDYDLKLYQMCVEQGWHFVDVAFVMRDANGCLYDDYCSDAPTMGMHFTDVACQVWIDYLKTHART